MKPSDYEILYDLPAGEYEGRGIDGVRTVTIRAGRSLEVMCHPIVKLTPQARREAKRRRTSPAMEKLNARNAERKHMRILEENFTPRAQVVTLTYPYPVEDYGMCDLKELSDIYDERDLPWEIEDVQRHKRNFLAKLKRRVIAAGGKSDSLKWDCTIEWGKEPPATGLPPKYHMHWVIEGQGIARETIQACWTHGSTRCELFDMENDGAARLAHYLNKMRTPGHRLWSHSRNLKIPQPRVSDRKVSRRRLALLAADIRHNGKEIMEKLYNPEHDKHGYRVVGEPIVRYSDYINGAYIYVRMRRD